jgi:hypothetical protein
MSEPRKLTDLSRQELYDLIWFSPATMVAADYGISDVAVHKLCIRKKVPRPTVGYWAKLAAGHKTQRKPLPPSAREVFEKMAQRPIPKTLALPGPDTQLHPLASELLAALNRTKPDHKQVRLERPEFPRVTVSKPLVERVAGAFHVILQALAASGIEFKKFQGHHEGGYFKWGQDRLYFHIDETVVDPLGKERKEYWYRWNSNCKPAGRLAFTTTINRWGNRDEKLWMETNNHSLERVLSEVVSAIRLHFLDMQRQRIKEAIEYKKWAAESEKRHREWLAEEAVRIQKEKEQAHLNAVQAAKNARKLDVIKAAEWWRKSCGISDFVEECESRWKSLSGELNPEQAAWLAWAREIATNISPFTVGYPDPAKHGAFDAATIQFGGPYPTAQNFSRPE